MKNKIILKKSILRVFFLYFVISVACSIILVALVIYFKYRHVFLGLPWQPALLIAFLATCVDYFSFSDKLILIDNNLIQTKMTKIITLNIDDAKIKNFGLFYFMVYSNTSQSKIIVSKCFSKNRIETLINSKKDRKIV